MNAFDDSLNGRPSLLPSPSPSPIKWTPSPLPLPARARSLFSRLPRSHNVVRRNRSPCWSSSREPTALLVVVRHVSTRSITRRHAQYHSAICRSCRSKAVSIPLHLASRFYTLVVPRCRCALEPVHRRPFTQG
jgi:hypothetical protein